MSPNSREDSPLFFPRTYPSTHLSVHISCGHKNTHGLPYQLLGAFNICPQVSQITVDTIDLLPEDHFYIYGNLREELESIGSVIKQFFRELVYVAIERAQVNLKPASGGVWTVRSPFLESSTSIALILISPERIFSYADIVVLEYRCRLPPIHHFVLTCGPSRTGIGTGKSTRIKRAGGRPTLSFLVLRAGFSNSVIAPILPRQCNHGYPLCRLLAPIATYDSATVTHYAASQPPSFQSNKVETLSQSSDCVPHCP